MALESQGCVLRRESSIAGSTATLSTNTIGFEGTAGVITREAGFADFSTGMRVECNASLNSGVYTISATAATAITVYEPLTDQASGSDITLLGHSMQEIGEVVSFNGPNQTVNIMDVTHMGSTAKEKLVSLYDGGDLSMGVFFDNESSSTALHDAIERDLRARTLRKWDIKFTDEGTSQPSAVYFEGYVTGFSMSGAVENPLRADISVAISSGVDWIESV